MKRQIKLFLLLFAVITGVQGTPVICHAEEADMSELIAGEGETVAAAPVGEEGMIPVYGKDIKDGVYSVEVESSSSMFRIVDAEVMVEDGNMTAVITLSGKGYSKLYMGTGEQAVQAEEDEYIAFVEDEEGAYTYTIPLEALNLKVDCTAFSKKKEKWYDRELVFRADTIPQEALLKALYPAVLDAADGTYTMEVSLTGGTGKAQITSPATVVIADRTGQASIQWSSPNYDYMIVNGEKILPVNEEGNSLFEIPVWAVDEEMKVLADTTAMSTPHEIEYTLVFHSDTLKKKGMDPKFVIGVLGAAMVIAVAVVIGMRMTKKKRF